MARRSSYLVLAILTLAALACNLMGDAAPQTLEVDAPVVEIRVPANNTTFAEGTRVILQAIATDASVGVSRVDLLVDDLVIASSNAPNPEGQAVYTATLEWLAQGEGLHSVTAVAFRADETASAPVTIAINVTEASPGAGVPESAGPQLTEIPAQETQESPPNGPPPVEEPTTVPEAPTEELPPAPETEATSGTPTGRVTIGLNVRTGPGLNYPILGALIEDTEVELLGRSRDAYWFVVPYGVGRGWVSAQFIETIADVPGLPVIQAPPPPPPTATPLPPTATPTATPEPPTASPVLPDLFIDGVTVNPPFPPRVGVTMTVQVTVRNQGQAATGEGFLVRLVFGPNDETTFIAFPPLEPGQSQTLPGFITLPEGTEGQSGNGNITADADNRIQESDENNNLHATAGYTVEAAEETEE